MAYDQLMYGGIPLNMYVPGSLDQRDYDRVITEQMARQYANRNAAKDMVQPQAQQAIPQVSATPRNWNDLRLWEKDEILSRQEDERLARMTAENERFRAEVAKIPTEGGGYIRFNPSDRNVSARPQDLLGLANAMPQGPGSSALIGAASNMSTGSWGARPDTGYIPEDATQVAGQPGVMQMGVDQRQSDKDIATARQTAIDFENQKLALDQAKIEAQNRENMLKFIGKGPRDLKIDPAEYQRFVNQALGIPDQQGVAVGGVQYGPFSMDPQPAATPAQGVQPQQQVQPETPQVQATQAAQQDVNMNNANLGEFKKRPELDPYIAYLVTEGADRSTAEAHANMIVNDPNLKAQADQKIRERYERMKAKSSSR